MNVAPALIRVFQIIRPNSQIHYGFGSKCIREIDLARGAGVIRLRTNQGLSSSSAASAMWLLTDKPELLQNEQRWLVAKGG